MYKFNLPANLKCNIDNTGRVTRLVIGAVLFIFAVLGMGRGFMLLIGLILILQSFFGYCLIPILTEKFKLDSIFDYSANLCKKCSSCNADLKQTKNLLDETNVNDSKDKNNDQPSS